MCGCLAVVGAVWLVSFVLGLLLVVGAAISHGLSLKFGGPGPIVGPFGAPIEVRAVTPEFVAWTLGVALLGSVVGGFAFGSVRVRRHGERQSLLSDDWE